MTVCTGTGDNGGHCCWIDGQLCEFLTVVDGLPRCGKLLELGTWAKVHRNRDWKRSPVGQWFKDNWPGYGCGDWPQHMPDYMAKGRGLCCWQGAQ